MKEWKRLVYTIAGLQIGTGITIIGVVSFIPLFLTTELGITDEGEAAFWAGLISGATPLFVAMASPVWSMEADKRGSRFALAMILAILSVVVFANYFVTSPAEFLMLRVLQGMSGGFVAVGMSLVMNITPKEKLPWSMGIFQSAMVTGVMFGPLAGGIIADLFGYRMPFLVFGSLTLLCLLAVLTCVPGHLGVSPNKKKESFLSKLRRFAKNPVIVLLIVMQFLCNFGMTGIGPILPLYVQQMMKGDAEIVATIVGVIIFISGATSVAASLSVQRLTPHFRMRNILIAASVATGINFILQYMMPTVMTLGFMRGLTGLSLGLIMPVANIILAASVPAEDRTMVVGFSASFSIMGNVAGPVASGILAMQMGYASVFWSTALCFFIAAAVIWAERDHLDCVK